jgi:creatinine amidohydrolase/Fe(II)-dependent formamide hydrolase-like protein
MAGPAADSSYALAGRTFPEVEKILAERPVLIVPLGGCEPYGGRGALGIASVCAEHLAAALSSSLKILWAPVIPIGCSTPYSAFGGTRGVSPRTMTNILCETIRQCFFQGFTKVILIDLLADNGNAVDLAVRRLKGSHPNCTIVVFAVQRDERVRAFIAKRSPRKEPGRSEFGILSMALFLNPGLVRLPATEYQKPGKAASWEPEKFRSWRKRGADPQQFRKLFPGGSSSDTADAFDPDFGKALFEFILKLLEETVSPLL